MDLVDITGGAPGAKGILTTFASVAGQAFRSEMASWGHTIDQGAFDAAWTRLWIDGGLEATASLDDWINAEKMFLQLIPIYIHLLRLCGQKAY